MSNEYALMETLDYGGVLAVTPRSVGRRNWAALERLSTLHDPCSPYHSQTMSNYCEPLLAALKDCILHSDCVTKDGKLPSECIKHHLDELPEECKSLRLATFECKRGMVYPFLPFQISNKRASHASLSLTCENASAEIVQVLLLQGSSKRTRLPVHRPQSYPRLRRECCFPWIYCRSIVVFPAQNKNGALSSLTLYDKRVGRLFMSYSMS